jgi:subtilisin family serine protease
MRCRSLVLPLLVLSALGASLAGPIRAAEYLVRSGSNAPDPKVAGRLAEAVAPYRALGLVLRRELRNLPGNLVAEMPAATASAMAAAGFDVQLLLPLHVTTDGPPWSLDRMNQRALPLDGSAARPYTGAGVRIFLLDTSLYPNLADLGNRVVGATDYLENGEGVYTTCGTDHTHASIVAGAAAGTLYGAAPGAEIFLLRIGDCAGTISVSAELAALDDLVTWRQANPTVPAVANMSFLGISPNPAEEALFQTLDSLGVLLVDAAGNNGDDACQYRPAASPETITVGISDLNDQRPPRSGFGTCVDLFAPGKDVPTLAGPQPVVASGSSISAPFVAGTLALLREQFPDLPAAALRKLLLQNATQGVLTGDLGAGSPNRLLYDGPVHEDVSRFIPRWFPAEHRFTTQIGVTINGTPTPFLQIRLFRGPAKDGRCQGQPFATPTLAANGTTVNTIVGWKQSPAFLCVETQAGTVFDRFVRTLP